jgi:protein-S-isoprenylcysteine O-methyltransferase Ste14
MSPIPAFELELWNAWILMLYMIFANVLPYVKSEWSARSGADMPLNETEKRISSVMSFLVFALIAYGIFLPLELGTVWLYVGFLIYLLGVVIMTLAMVNLFNAPAGKPVTKGVYRISRNPGYFGMFLVFGGTGIACASWVFLLLTAVVLS